MSVVVAEALSCLPTVAIGVIRKPHARPGGDGPAPCSIAPTLSHWRYVGAQLMIATFALFLHYFIHTKIGAQLLVEDKRRNEAGKRCA